MYIQEYVMFQVRLQIYIIFIFKEKLYKRTHIIFKIDFDMIEWKQNILRNRILN